MTMTEWAEREVEIACETFTNESREESDLPVEYFTSCYESALKAYNSLMDDGHSGMSFGITRNILDNLMNNIPLTPIEDVEDVWKFVWEDEGAKTWQCARRASLFKKQYPDGHIEYSDNERWAGKDINTGLTYDFGFLNRIMNELYPIKFPYCPGKTIYIDCEDFLQDPNNGDCDHFGVFSFKKEDGTVVEVNRFFKEEKGKFVEIDRDTYYLDKNDCKEK